ncbi:PAS domain S-box protein [Candidatus Magnetominusculus dajiuhuensis]|uniref:PAS domain S-box protein n=1 Tax=Candidatus Magnetominusculus dajiuhuensis TaxID=3137712 RepID=UPI003B42D1BD
MKDIGKRRVIYLIAIFAAVVLIVLATTEMLLYQTAVKQQTLRLRASAELRIRMIELETEHQGSGKCQRQDSKSLPTIEEKVIGEIQKINERSYHGFTMPVEFVWGRREGNDIIFLLPLRHSKVKSVPFNSGLAGPMRLALKGQAGTIIGLDYRGKKVLSVFAPLNFLDRHTGIVAKIDMQEIRAPFIRVGIVAFFVAIAVILAGVFAFLKITNPMLLSIQESENKFRGLVEQSFAGIYIVQHKKLIYVNPRFAEIFGYDNAEDLIGISPIDLVYADDGATVSENIRKRLDHEVYSINYCVRGVKKDDEIVHIEIHGSRTTIKNVPAIVGFIIDVTKRIEDDEKLQQLAIAQEASRAKNEVLSMVSHELRTPLNGISGLAQTLINASDNGWLTIGYADGQSQ